MAHLSHLCQLKWIQPISGKCIFNVLLPSVEGAAKKSLFPKNHIFHLIKHCKLFILEEAFHVQSPLHLTEVSCPVFIPPSRKQKLPKLFSKLWECGLLKGKHLPHAKIKTFGKTYGHSSLQTRKVEPDNSKWPFVRSTILKSQQLSEFKRPISVELVPVTCQGSAHLLSSGEQNFQRY